MIRRAAPLVAALLLAACSNAAGESKDAAYRRGVAALDAGQPRVARIEFLNAIQADPNKADTRLMQARTYLELGDGVAAEAELDRALKLGRPNASLRHLLAHAYLLQGDRARAMQEAAAAPAQYAAYAARVRGLAMMAEGDSDGAAKAFDQAIKGAPRDPETWSDFARFRRSMGDLAGSIAAIDKALVLRPADAEAVMLRGELTRGQYGLKAALPWFDRALEIDPNNVTALLERAATLSELGRMSEMLETTRKVLTLSPDHPTAYYLQAVLAARARRYDLARSLLDRTGDAVDVLPAAMLLRGALDYQAGNYGSAIDRLDALVDRQPDNAKARRLLAAAQWRSGDAGATVATLRPIADRPNADSYSLTLMGRALAASGDAAGAARYYAGAARPQEAMPGVLGADSIAELQRQVANGGGVPAQIALVRALLAVGQGDNASARARQLLRENPGAPDAHILVGDTLGMQGKFAAAAEEYRKAANLAFTEPVALRLVEALERSQQEQAAAQVLELFLEQNPRSVPAQLLAARRLMVTRQWPPAIAIYEGLRRRLGDRDAALLNNLAWAYFQQGDAHRAIPLARKAWALDKANPVTTDTLGWLLLKSGRSKAEGLALLQRAVIEASANPG